MNEFISKFTEWYRNVYKGEKPEAFKHALRKAITLELPLRNNSYELQVREFDFSDNINILINDENLWTSISKENRKLIVGSKRPLWHSGWRKFTKNEDINDIIDTFFHFSSQYYVRSKQIDLIGACNLVYGIYGDFRGSRFSSIKVTSERPMDERMKFLAFDIETNFDIDIKNDLILYWFEKINSLDPYINRIIFNFNKSLALNAANFDEETITALDKTLNVVEQYWKQRVGNQENLREALLVQLEFTTDQIDISNKLYELRCFFGGHPGNSKWWDFSEIYSEELGLYIEHVQMVIEKIILHENENRIIEKNTLDISGWFYKNMNWIWDIVWFNKVP